MAAQLIDLDDVLEATSVLVDDLGRDRLSLAVLADHLEVKLSTLDNHVNGIDGLWHEFAVHATNRLADRLAEAAVARSGQAAMRHVATTYRDFARRHPGQFASLLLPPTSTEDALTDARQRIVDVFVRVIASFDSGRDRTVDQLVHSARIVRSAIHGFVALESIDGMPSPQERDVSFNEMLQLLIDGIISNSGP